MRKVYKTMLLAAFCSSLGLGTLGANTAKAGPLIEFGDEGYLQIDVKFQGIMENTDFGSGQDGQGNRWDFNLRRARLVFTGMLNDTWGAKFQSCGGTSATQNFGSGGYELAKSNSKDNSQMRVADGYLIGLINDSFNIKAGLTKIPLTRDNLVACFAPLTAERSAFVYSPFGTDATKNSRDMGLMASGNFSNDHFKYWAAVMEGREGTSEFNNPFNGKDYTSSPEPKSNLEYIARMHYSFWDPELKPTAMGYKGSYLGQRGKILTIAMAGAYEADAAYKNVSMSADTLSAVVTGDETVDYSAYTTDLFLEYPFQNSGVLTATAAYLNVDFDDAYKTTSAVADRNTIVGGPLGQREGYYVKAGYILPFRVGDEGMIQPFARYENWDVAAYFQETDQTVEQYGVGVNYFVLGNDKLRFTFEYTRTDYDKPAHISDYTGLTQGNTFDGYDLFTGMFMVQI
jgi:hypothetical protein